jgi:hypothetical protein
MKYGKPNRHKRQQPKKGKSWCMSCDAGLVGKGEKCPSCNKPHGVKKFKKRDISDDYS